MVIREIHDPRSLGSVSRGRQAAVVVPEAGEGNLRMRSPDFVAEPARNLDRSLVAVGLVVVTEMRGEQADGVVGGTRSRRH